MHDMLASFGSYNIILAMLHGDALNFGQSSMVKSSSNQKVLLPD